MGYLKEEEICVINSCPGSTTSFPFIFTQCIEKSYTIYTFQVHTAIHATVKYHILYYNIHVRTAYVNSICSYQVHSYYFLLHS